MQLANQSLGIILYEKLVENYIEMNLVVKQSWYEVCLFVLYPQFYNRQHYLDISFVELTGMNR